eukprot:tig00020557_g11121.t2
MLGARPAGLALWARCPPSRTPAVRRAPKRIDCSGAVRRASLFGPVRRAPKRINCSRPVRRASLFGPDVLRRARPQSAGRPSASIARGPSGGPRSLGQMSSVARARSPQGAQAHRLLGGRPAGLALWARCPPSRTPAVRRAPKRIDCSGAVRRASLFGPVRRAPKRIDCSRPVRRASLFGPAERALPSLEAGGARAVSIRDSLSAQLQHAKLALAILNRYDSATGLLRKHSAKPTAKRYDDLLDMASRLVHVERRMCGLRALCTADVDAAGQDAFAADVTLLALRVREAADRGLEALQAIAARIEASGGGAGRGSSSSALSSFAYLSRLSKELDLIMQVEAIEGKRRWLFFDEDKKVRMEKLKDAYLRYRASFISAPGDIVAGVATLFLLPIVLLSMGEFCPARDQEKKKMQTIEEEISRGKSEVEVENAILAGIKEVRSNVLEEIQKERAEIAARIDAGKSFTQVVAEERMKKNELDEQLQKKVAKNKSELEGMAKALQATIPELQGALRALWQRLLDEPVVEVDPAFPALLKKIQAGVVGGLGFAVRFAREAKTRLLSPAEVNIYKSESYVEAFFRAILGPLFCYMSSVAAVLLSCGCAGVAAFLHFFGDSAAENASVVAAVGCALMAACGWVLPHVLFPPSSRSTSPGIRSASYSPPNPPQSLNTIDVEKKISALKRKADAIRSVAKADEDSVAAAWRAWSSEGRSVGDLFPASSFDEELRRQYTELLRRLHV